MKIRFSESTGRMVQGATDGSVSDGWIGEQGGLTSTGGWIGEQGGLTSTGGWNGEEDRLQMEIPPRVGEIKKTRVKGGSFLCGNIHDEDGRKEQGSA